MDRGFRSTDFLDLIKAIDFASKTFCTSRGLWPFSGKEVCLRRTKVIQIYMLKEIMNFHIDLSTFLEKTALRL